VDREQAAFFRESEGLENFGFNASGTRSQRWELEINLT
jgi:hypothetical protein